MSEIKDIGNYELRKSLKDIRSIYEDVKEFMRGVEFFVQTLPLTLIALELSKPSPGLAELYERVLLTTKEEIETPRISLLRNFCDKMEQFIAAMRSNSDFLSLGAIRKEIEIERIKDTVAYYWNLERDTKLVLKSAEYAGVPFVSDETKQQAQAFQYPQRRHTSSSKTQAQSKVKRIDERRAKEGLNQLKKIGDKFNFNTKGLPADLGNIMANTDIGRMFPQLPLFAQSLVETRDVILYESAKLQDMLQEHIDNMNQEQSPDKSDPTHSETDATTDLPTDTDL